MAAGLSEFRLMDVDSEKWKRQVRRLADRLGVSRVGGDDKTEFRVTLYIDENEKYDVMELVHAFLDKMEGSDK